MVLSRILNAGAVYPRQNGVTAQNGEQPIRNAQHTRNAQSINEFKKEIKSWNGADCTCRLCST